MPNPKRTTDVRLIVIVTVDLGDPEFAATLKTARRQPSSVADVVADEVVSNLETVSYVDAVIVSQL